MRLWDAATGQEALTLKGHTAGVKCLAFSPNGNRLASAGQDTTVKVWDTTTGLETLTLKGHADVVRWVAFSPDGGQIASMDSGGTVKVWDGRPMDAALAKLGVGPR